MHDDYRAQHILREKMSNSTAGFLAKNTGFHGFLWFFEAPTPFTCTKAYLRYLMSLAVILLLIAMLTAGPGRLYRIARSHVSTIARTDCMLIINYLSKSNCKKCAQKNRHLENWKQKPKSRNPIAGCTYWSEVWWKVSLGLRGARPAAPRLDPGLMNQRRRQFHVSVVNKIGTAYMHQVLELKFSHLYWTK